MMDNTLRMAQRLVGIHGKMARAAWPDGGTLECVLCGQTRRFSSSEGARYLTQGWPKCCMRQMRVAESVAERPDAASS